MTFNQAILKAIRWRKRYQVISIVNIGSLWPAFDTAEGQHKEAYLVLDRQRLRELAELEKHPDLFDMYVTKLLRKLEAN